MRLLSLCVLWLFGVLPGPVVAATEYCVAGFCQATEQGACNEWADSTDPGQGYVGVVGGAICYRYRNGNYTNAQQAITSQEAPEPCQSGGTATENFTVGWAKSRTPDANDYVNAIEPPPPSYCKNGCQRELVGVLECWRSQQAGPNGLFRASCDYKTTGAGVSCGSPAPSSTDPNAPSPPCPGVFGEVNGKPVCIDPSGAPVPPVTPPTITPEAPERPASGGTPTIPPITPIGAGGPGAPSQGPGNPAAGEKPDTGPGSGSGGSGRTPATGDGGNAGGGSSAATPGGGSTNADAGGEPTEITVEVCGLPGKPACKLDETGTPTGLTGGMQSDVASWGASDTGLRGTFGVDGAGVKPPELVWTLGIEMPAQVCSAFQMWKPGGTWSIDLCSDSRIAALRSLMAWFLASLAALYVFRTVVRSIGRGE